MSRPRLCASHLRLADELAEAFHAFAGAVDPLAVALTESVPGDRLAIAADFLTEFAEARRRFEDRCYEAVRNSTARDQEHTG